LDSRTISGFFNGYSEKSKRYRFYCLNDNTRIFNTENDKFIENDEVSESETPHNMKIWEVSVQIILLFTSFKVVVPQIIKQFNNYQEQQINDYIPYNKDIVDEPIIDELQEITLKRSQRKKKVCYFKWLCGISTRIRI